MATIIIDGIDASRLFEKLLDLIARPREQLTPIHTIQMTKPTHRRILDRMVWQGREDAGLLLGPKGHHCVTHFIPDEAGDAAGGTFTLDGEWLSRVLRRYVEHDLDCKGIIHMHPPGYRRLSPPDLVYARKLMGNPKNTVDRLLMPLVVDGRIYPYIIFPGDPITPHEGDLVLF